MFKKILAAAATTAAVFAMSTSHAADMTGAGATFPYPIYAKWAESYKAATGNGLNYRSSVRAPASSRSRPRPWTSALPTCRSRPKTWTKPA